MVNVMFILMSMEDGEVVASRFVRSLGAVPLHIELERHKGT